MLCACLGPESECIGYNFVNFISKSLNIYCSPNVHTENNGSSEGDYEHDYDHPFFEPATQEEELVSQITELNIPLIPASKVK